MYYAQYYIGTKQKRVSLGTDSLQVAKERIRQIESALVRGTENITDACIDMSKSFIKGLQEEEQEQRLCLLTRFDLGSIKAYILKLGLQFVYCAQDRQEAESLLRRWYRRAIRSKVERIVKLAKSIKKHWQGILSYFDSRLTNGFLEEINNLIQAARVKAQGYRNPGNVIAMA